MLLCTSNKHTKKAIRKTIPFTISSKTNKQIQYLRIILKPSRSKTHIGKIKLGGKKLKKTLEDGKTSHFMHGQNNIVKVAILERFQDGD
jgi:hypothetical protein